MCITSNAFAENLISDPCAGILNLVDRPSKADSACAVPYKRTVVEVGLAYANLSGGGHNYNLPQPEIRFGLPQQFELAILPPNYNIQSVAPMHGFGPASFGLKRQFGNFGKWITAAEIFLAPPSGNKQLGTQDWSSTVSGIVSYTISPTLNLTGMLGYTTQSMSKSAGGKRFQSINPDLILTYSINDNLEVFIEGYSQTKVSNVDGPGYNVDAAILYAISKNMEIDVEVGQRISGHLGGFERYVGFGTAISI